VVSRTLKMIVLFFLPLTVLTIILRQPVIELLASKDVAVDLVGSTALALAAFAISFVFYASEMVLMQTYFSLQNTWLPTVIGAASSFAQVAFLYVAFDMVGSPDSAAGAWLRGMGVTPFIVVALAYPISRAFKNLVLGSVLHFELKLFHLRDVLSFVPQAVLVTAATGAAAFGAWAAVSGVELTTVGKVIRLGVPSAAATVAFLAALFALKLIGWPVAEFDIILKWLHESGWQKIQRRLRGGKTPKGGEAE
jgi:peptidoglycan biosynthesis protein MviN/MurJ (putative lipid II flippase)